MKVRDLSFLHTGEVHISTFQNLIEELSSGVSTNHVVDIKLLEHAQKYGVDDFVRSETEKHLQFLVDNSRVVICTCSTLGEIAENFGNSTSQNIHRIDRAMSDYAVRSFNKILVLTTLESTIQPTLNLLSDSSKNQNKNPNIEFLCIGSAWNHFITGKAEEYYQEIARYINENAPMHDLVLLAQASMVGAEKYSASDIPIVSSPRIGIRHALSSLEESVRM